MALESYLILISISPAQTPIYYPENIDLLEKIVKFILDSIGQPISIKKIVVINILSQVQQNKR